MTRKSYTAVINYLDDNKIHVDKDEFELQLEGHPDFPSLLAFSDALHFFNIESYSYRIDNDEKDILPEDFLALVEGELAVVNKKNNKIAVNGLQTEDFFSKWENIILIVDQSEEQPHTKSKFEYAYINWGIIVVLFLFLFGYDSSNLVLKSIFAITSLVGFIFAYEAFKKTHGKGTFIPVGVCKSDYLNTDCDMVFNSKKWKIFNKIDLSEISLLFFTSQIVCFILFSLIKNIEFLFEIYRYGLFAFLPVAFLSLFYQIFVVKKYCPVCMVIIASVCIQLLVTNLIFFTGKKINMSAVILFLIGSLGALVVLLNLRIKNKNAQKNENTFKRNLKFRRNYQFFKNNLSLQKRLTNKDFSSAFVFGNENADQSLTFITNPFCKHCKEFYPVFLKLVKKYSDELRINIFFDVDLSREDLDNRMVHINLTNIYINSENKIEFLEALSGWYDVQGYSENKDGWYTKYSKYFGSSENALELLKRHEKWVSSNSVHFTPNIFINDMEYPIQYERADLEFFIPEFLSENLN
ncbi:vitamin K epoxide reductase family protein [Chryseobacterium sediminis]|uniref:Vitamin K epoxide reductase family protein n=1 Tax=Chryseobacterium sediminis TaxID=1679494 RepID=A0A5B2TV78_9FLAO|nr:vitamin K epoxide reductase family protein [Chryseobacterium sediminis]KAA2217715.1 vitamin K epoxide reductase family protein [Chryseobacterium sediminis]